MELYRNTTNAFISYLKKHGYPEKCIALEWGNKQCAIDVAVLAENLLTPIAIYEIKGRKRPDTIRAGISQLKRAVQTLDITVPCNLVFSEKNAVGFEVVDVSGIIYNNEELDVQSIMESQPLMEPISYQNIQAGVASKVVSRSVERKQEKIDRIKPICWIVFPVIALVLLLLDALGIYTISFLRLAVLGATVIIVLVPFFSEISLKDFTLKRKGRD